MLMQGRVTGVSISIGYYHHPITAMDMDMVTITDGIMVTVIVTT